MARTRVALLSPYTDPIRGGITSYVRELAAAYESLGVDRIGYATTGQSNPAFEVLGPSKFLFISRATVALLRWRPDVIHAHSQHWYILAVGMLIKLLRPRTRLLFTFHTPVTERQTRGITKLAHLLLSLSDGVVFVSHDMLRFFNLPPSIRQHVILAAPEKRALQCAKERRISKRPTIVFTGPLVWPKKVAGVLLLVRAFARLAHIFPQWQLAVVGDGPFRPEVQREIMELGLADRVSIRGFIDAVFDEVMAAEVYAQVSLQEGLPLAVLDAMACRTAILATAVGGLPEIIRNGETGLLVEPTLEGVTAGLKRLMSDGNLRSQLAASAYEFVARELSWEKTAAESLKAAIEGRM